MLRESCGAGDVEQAILKLTQEWLDAEERADRATLRRIIADDFQGTAPMGNTVFKEDVIPEEGSPSGLALTPSNMKARVFGDTAVVTCGGCAEGRREAASEIYCDLREARGELADGGGAFVGGSGEDKLAAD